MQPILNSSGNPLDVSPDDMPIESYSTSYISMNLNGGVITNTDSQFPANINNLGAGVSVAANDTWYTICNVSGNGRFIGAMTAKGYSAILRVAIDGKVYEKSISLSYARRGYWGYTPHAGMGSGGNYPYGLHFVAGFKGMMPSIMGAPFKQSLKVETYLTGRAGTSEELRGQAIYQLNFRGL